MKNKLVFTFFVFSFLFLSILGKSLYIQVLKKDKLVKYSNSQFIRETKIYPNRGLIYDRNNNPLAINIQTYNIFAIPKTQKEISKSLKVLKKLLPKKVTSKLVSKVKKRMKFTWITRNLELNEEVVAQIKDLEGIYIEQSPKRFYPNNELLAQTLGFVGIDNSGLAGIEYMFNKKLKGDSKKIKYYKDAKGRPIRLESLDKGVAAQDITLSVDKEIQAHLESYLKESVEEFAAVKGGAAIMDAQTGEIIALANYPTFDPNHYREYPQENRKLSFATDPFEPGSTFKTLTVISALENKIIDRNTNFYCERGKLLVGNHIISEAEDKKKHEWLSVEEILKYSSNIGTTKIAFDLTYPKLRETIGKFHFGKKTGVEIPGESRGIFKDVKNVPPLELSNISFGQGIATNSFQMMTLYAAIANGGYLVRPTLLKVNDPEKVEKKKVISQETVEEITQMLITAVEDGTGGKARIPYVKVAGKTSTAQKSKNGTYQGHIGGFIGFPTGVKKKYVTYVYIDEPSKNGYYGNLVAGPIFKKINEFILFKNKEFARLAGLKENRDKDTVDKIDVSYSSVRKAVKGEVPNFIGLDKFSAEKLAAQADLDIIVNGFGVVNSQSLEPGSKISSKTITLKFSAPEYD